MSRKSHDMHVLYAVCVFRLIFLISFIKVYMNNAKRRFRNNIVADYERNLQAERNKILFGLQLWKIRT